MNPFWEFNSVITKLNACNMRRRAESFTDQTDKKKLQILNAANQIQKARVKTSSSARSRRMPFKYEGIF